MENRSQDHGYNLQVEDAAAAKDNDIYFYVLVSLMRSECTVQCHVLRVRMIYDCMMLYVYLTI